MVAGAGNAQRRGPEALFRLVDEIGPASGLAGPIYLRSVPAFNAFVRLAEGAATGMRHSTTSEIMAGRHQAACRSWPEATERRRPGPSTVSR